MAMEYVEMEALYNMSDESEDFGTSIVNKFSRSTREDHQHLCAVIGAMSQELKDHGVALSPAAYFLAAVSSLERLSSDPSTPNHSIEALLTILSMIMPRVSAGVLRKSKQDLSKLVARVLLMKGLSPAATAAGLKCASHLLMVKDGVGWSDVSQLYGFLLNFVTDSHPKVRRQSHLCIRDVLQNFKGTPLLAPASEGITNIFERFLLLAGGSSTDASEGPKGAQEVLYVLDAMKDCFVYISQKYKSILLKYFKTLLDLHLPLVSRRVIDCLNALCIYPELEISPELLLDLLCSLALSISTNETSADGMTFTARLLDTGMNKVFALNRRICIVKLPLIFTALRDILAFDYEEALYASAEAIKSLIRTCIDEDIVQHGVDHTVVTASLETRNLGPTIIERLCAIVGSLLGYQYSAIWDLAFQIVSLMFDKLGVHSYTLLSGTLQSLAEMQKLSDEDFPYRKQLHECVGSALGAMGPERFLTLLPLNLVAEDLSKANVWLFPILKQYTVGASLHFYINSLLGVARSMKKKSQQFEKEGKMVSSRNADAIVYSLWSLLPSFCTYPLDTADSFEDLKTKLCTALSEEPNLHGIICSSLCILIQQNKQIVGSSDVIVEEVSTSVSRAMAYYTHDVASKNLITLKSYASDILSALLNAFMESSNMLTDSSNAFVKSYAGSVGSLQKTIGQFASISEQAVVSRIFKRTMRRLEKVTQNASEILNYQNSMQIDNMPCRNSPSHMRGQLLDLAVSLLPGLSAQDTEFLFRIVVQALNADDGVIQKKAYKVLSVILKSRDDRISMMLEDLPKLMIEVLPSCHFSAKHHRLDCLYHLILTIFQDNQENCGGQIISSFLTEIILALKEANKKTRNRAYEILVQIGHACGDEDKGGNKENLLQFFNMVAGGMAGDTSHMISAAVKGLARLAYEFSDLISTAFNVLPSSFLLLKRKNREISKANLGLVKVLIAKSPTESLLTHLRSLVEGLLKWQDDIKNHFKAKVKHLLEMLVKRCGVDAVRAVMPVEHLKLFTNIRKIKERRERKLSSNSETRSHDSKATTSRMSKWNHTKIFSDIDEEASDEEYMDGKLVSSRRNMLSSKIKSKTSSLRSKRAARSVKSLPEDFLDQLEDEPLDLLDQLKTRSALHSASNRKRKLDSDDELEVDPSGRIIICEETKAKKDKTADHELEEKSEAGSYASVKSSRKSPKRKKTTESGWAYTGSEYASKKARGDLKRSGKLEPYAYWPLDRKMVSRRPEHRAAARKGMASVVRLSKQLEGNSASGVLSRFKKNHKKAAKRKIR